MTGVNKQAAEDRVNMGKREVVKREDYEEEDDHEKYYRLLQVWDPSFLPLVYLLPV